MITQSGEELKLVGGGEFFNGYDNSRHLGNTKVAKVIKQVIKHLYHFSKKPPNPLKRLVGAQGLEPWTRCLKGSGSTNETCLGHRSRGSEVRFP